jgi:hypothetical protein
LGNVPEQQVRNVVRPIRSFLHQTKIVDAEVKILFDER